MKTVKAMTNFDSYMKGAEFDLPPEYAQAVIDKGLAVEVKQKAAPAPANKMAAEPANKATKGRAS